MKTNKLIRVGAVIATVFALAGCAPAASEEPIGGDIIAPVTMSANDLQGTDVELLVGQVLNINTDSLAVDSYTGEVADSMVAEFVPGEKKDDTEFNPGVRALSTGTTEVTMTNEQGGIQPLEFTVTVIKK
jgi:outer membrane murein-binding lipoprotein Lpp